MPVRGKVFQGGIVDGLNEETAGFRVGFACMLGNLSGDSGEGVIQKWGWEGWMVAEEVN